MLDLKVVDGLIADVEGGRFLRGDIGIKDGKIDSLGIVKEEAEHTIRAEGKLVSPGFIDIHMHEEDLRLIGDLDYDISLALLTMGVTTCVGGNCGSNRNDIAEFLNFIETRGYPLNFMTYVGHNSLRQQVGNENSYHKSNKKQIDLMRGLIDQALDLGAIGLSLGIEYCPGIDEEEMVRICDEIKGRQDLLISVHARRDSKFAPEALREIERLGKAVSIPLQISHLSSVCAYGNMEEGLAVIETMLADGMNVQADAYPYGAFSCKIGSSVFDEGCFENWGKSYEAIMLAEEPYKGVVCDEELFHRMRRDYPGMYVIASVMNEKEVETAIQRPYVMVGSDGGFNQHQGHPRGAGTFPRYLGRFSREGKVLSLMELLKKMTIMPAKRLHIAERKGEIKLGFDADLVILDYDRIVDGATFAEPQRRPEGIKYVILDGKIAVNGKTVLHRNLGRFIPHINQ